MLFNEFSFFDYSFPEPQYLGAKHTHLAWINKFIPSQAKTALDAFSGSQSVSYLLKQKGLTVHTNDFLNFNHQIGVALIENSDITLSKKDIEVLFNLNHSEDYQLITNTFSNIFFEHAESLFLDSFRANIEQLNNPIKQALAFAVMNRAMTRKVTMGHFAHTQALVYAASPERVKRNKSLITPLKSLFLDLLPTYNAAVFDNRKNNKSYNDNILNLLPTIANIDLAYFDPPYVNSHADYQSFYHVLETFTVYWKNKEFINGTKRYSPPRQSFFDKKREVISSFEQLFQSAEHIPYWLISYNDRSYPDTATFIGLLKKYRDVVVESKQYRQSRGGKGSVAGSNELLFICSPKSQY